MAIAMQGNWTVRVKSKSAVYGQRFVIAGGTSADGIHPGNTGAPAIFVAGSQWSIVTQNQPFGGGWTDSAQRITFPTVSAGLLTFEIRSDDALVDRDYDDLVLVCSMPISASEFVVYGRARTYDGPCIFNPCYRPYYLIDSVAALERAKVVPGLANLVTKLYPERVLRPRPGPTPDPAPFFRPLVLPVGQSVEAGGLEFQSNRETAVGGLDPILAATTNQKSRAKALSAEDRERQAVERLDARAVRIRTESAPIALGASRLEAAELLSLATIVDQARIALFCATEPAPGLLLRFQEYDRTASERAGGPYTGTGDHENLGVAATDALGNYIFRFSRSLADFAAESTDISIGESPTDAIRPDLIVQVIGTGVVDYESAPYFDIPNLRRIDLCLPQGTVHPSRDCAGDRPIQRIGDIVVLDSALGGHPNTLDADGRITARNSGAPPVDCAGWRGSLRLYACLGTGVKTYTIRYLRAGIDTDWQFVQEGHTLDHIPDFAPNYNGTPVGASLKPVRVDGGALANQWAYENHDGDSNWIENDLKIQLSSSLYRPTEQPGSVDFRIQGYDAGGAIVAGADDTIRLYVHNQSSYLGRPQNSKGDIATITMGATTLGDCGLFELPTPNAPLTVHYRAVDPAGFIQGWGLAVTRGNNVGLPISVSGGVTPKSFPPPGPTPCAFHGTRDEGTANADDYVDTTLVPQVSGAFNGNWLPVGKNFCAFAFTLTVNDRVTDGRAGGTYPQVVFWQDVIGLSAT